MKKDPTVQLLVFDHAGEKAFSGGVDVADHTEDKVDEMIEVFHGMFRLMVEIDVPTVAVVNGVALGGGCELISFCDMVVASERSRIGQPEIAVGVFPPVAAAWFPKIIGLKKTYELLLTGKMISAKEAEAIGLVNAVIPTEGFTEGVGKVPGRAAEQEQARRHLDEEGDQGGAEPRFRPGPQGVGDHLPAGLHGHEGRKRRHHGIHGEEKARVEGRVDRCAMLLTPARRDSRRGSRS